MTDVLTEVAAERARQDAQWGGPLHDDDHAIVDWIGFMRAQLVAIAVVDVTGHRGYLSVASARERFVKVAALAVAACESIDRRELRGEW